MAGIYGALTTAITGLRAQSYALGNISGNIANSQTIGFKRTETTFIDLVPDAPYTQQQAGAVTSQSRSTNNVQGDITTSSIGTHIAVNGEGFFLVSERIGEVGGQPLFDPTNFYTRRGDFHTDQFGYLVNGSGYYLQGFEVDPATNNISGSSPAPIQISTDVLPASATTQIDYRANLPSYPLTSNADTDTANSELLDATAFANDPRSTATGTANGFVQANDVSDFLEQSITGGAVTIYDAGGQPINIQVRWAKLSSGTTDTWNAFYQESSTATGTAPAWRNFGEAFTFDNAGQLTAPTSSEIVRNFTVDGATVPSVTFRFGSNGLTQFADSNGQTKVTNLEQNGYPTGDLTSVAVSNTGRVTASYSNGRTRDIAAVATATFNGVNALQKKDGGAFAATNESGAPILSTGSNINGAALESSNVDIAEEFTKLIVTQQAYSASTRVVSTSDEMLQEALNMVR